MCCGQANPSLFTLFFAFFFYGKKSRPIAKVAHSKAMQWKLSLNLVHLLIGEFAGEQGDGDVCREAARVGLVWRLPSCLWRHPTPFRGKASALHLCPLADCPASHHPLLLLLVRKTAGSTLLTIYYGSSSSSSISTLLKASDQPRLPPSPPHFPAHCDIPVSRECVVGAG